jgi:hypothetical protein
MINIRVNKKRGFVEAKDVSEIGVIVDVLSGRKLWKDEGLYFDPNASNLDLIKSFSKKIKFIDDDGVLAKIDELENLQDQYADLPKLNVDYEPKRSYLPIQEQTLRQSHNRKIFAHLHPPDNGKTAIQIHEAGILFRQGKITGAIIVAPNTVDQQWIEEEIDKDLDSRIRWYGQCWDKKPKREKDFNQYKGMLEFFSLNIDSFSRGTKGIDATINFIRAHQGRVIFILDESHDIRNVSKRTDKLLAIANDEKSCVGYYPEYKRISTGTLIGKSLMDAFTQFKFLDQRILKHKFKTSFQSQFCHMGGYEGREVIGSKNEETFWKLIAPHSFRIGDYEKEDTKEPEFIYHKYKIDKKLKPVYTDMKETFLAQIDSGEISTVKTGLTAQMRLQEIVSGFLAIDQEPIQGSTRKPKRKIKMVSDQRAKFCLEIVKKIKGPTIVWVRFIPDFDILTKTFQKEGLIVDSYRGTKKRKKEIKEKFLSGELDVMIANPASGGVGLNLQGLCTEDVFYSLSHNSIHYWQSLKRIDRRGATGDITHHIIRCTSTVDVGIQNNLAQKKRTKKRSLDDVRLILSGDKDFVNKSGVKKKSKAKKISDQDLEELLL